MKVLTKRLILATILLSMGALPSLAKIDGGISKQHFYDLKKTIMEEVTLDTQIKTEKYWEKNLFYSNKYHPIFMLSNKELYNFSPQKKASVFQRVITPSIYNISLKTSGIKKVSLSSPPKKVEASSKPALTQTAKAENLPPRRFDFNPVSTYEQVKNPGVSVEEKISAAMTLKESRNFSNYALALDLLDDVIRMEPYNAFAYQLKGEIFADKNEPEVAMQNFAQALKLNPYSKESCLGIAKLLEPTNKGLAQKYYDMALK